MFSINEHSPQSVAVSILNLAGFSVSASAISNDPAFWFYEVLISMFEETPASKKKLNIKPLTLKSIELGTNGGQRSKDLIKNSSSLLKLIPSKENKSPEEINIEALNELFIKKHNCLPKREDLVFITKKIKEFDPFCPKIPHDKHRKSVFIEWFGKNYKLYEVFINSLMK